MRVPTVLVPLLAAASAAAPLLPASAGAGPGRPGPVSRISLLRSPAGPAGQDERPRVVGEALDGAVRDLPLDGLELDDPRELGVVLVRFEGTAPPPPPDAAAAVAELRLVGGDRLRGRIAGGTGETLRLELVGDVELPVPIEEFESLVVPARIPERRTVPVEPPPELDRLYRRTGAALDPVDGTVERFTDEGVVFDSLRLGSATFPWDEVAALFVEPLGSAPPPAEREGAPVVVDLVDGSRVRGRLVRLAETGVRLRVGESAEVELPLGAVAELAVDDGSLAFLSELPPAAPEEGRGNPFDAPEDGEPLGLVWPFRVDRAATGGPLVAGGRTWRRGIGAHAPSRITWDLGGRWSQLRGSVAVDASAIPLPAEGSVVFRVELDGETAWESPVVRGGDPPLAFPPLDLAGRRALALVADPAGDGHAGDRANWLRLVLVRDGGATPDADGGEGEGAER